jgi:hypothetical protein
LEDAPAKGERNLWLRHPEEAHLMVRTKKVRTKKVRTKKVRSKKLQGLDSE